MAGQQIDARVAVAGVGGQRQIGVETDDGNLEHGWRN